MCAKSISADESEDTQHYVIRELIEDTVASIAELFPKNFEYMAYCYLTLPLTPSECGKEVDQLQLQFPDSVHIKILATSLIALSELVAKNKERVARLNLHKLTEPETDIDTLVTLVSERTIGAINRKLHELQEQNPNLEHKIFVEYFNTYHAPSITTPTDSSMVHSAKMTRRALADSAHDKPHRLQRSFTSSWVERSRPHDEGNFGPYKL